MKKTVVGALCAMVGGWCSADVLTFGPDKSLAEIRDAVRAHRSGKVEGWKGGKVEVVLEDGVYRVERSLELTAEDSGVVFTARNVGKAVLSGAIDPAWRRPTADELAAAPLAALSEEAKREVRVADVPGIDPLPGFFTGGCMLQYAKRLDHPLFLVQDGEWLPLSRYPNDDWLKTGKFLGGTRSMASAAGGGVPEYKDAALAVEADAKRLAAWAAEPDLWAHGFWAQEWCDARLMVTNVDVKAGAFRMKEDYPFKFHEKVRYRIMNAAAEIDEPGEWMLDRKNRRLVLWPKGNSLPKLPWTKTLIQVEKAKDLTFDGLVLEGAHVNALVIKDCEGVVVRRSAIRECGGWGVTITGGRQCRVLGCDLYALGEGGVTLAGGDSNSLEPSEHVADNNHIHHYGLVIPNYRPGVSLNGVGNRATHNLIHHSLHQGVSFAGNDHYLGYNVIHDTCMHNDDAGAVYSWQNSLWKRGTVIEHNLIYFTGKKPVPTHTQSIYLDDWSSGTRVRYNILVRASNGLSMGGGHNTLVESNIVVRTLESPINFSSRGPGSFADHAARLGYRSGLMKDLAAKTNAVAASPQKWGRYPHLMDVFSYKAPDGEDPGKFAHHQLWSEVVGNLYVCTPAFQDAYFKKVAAYNVCSNNVSTQEDPGFADYAKLDFSPKKGGAYESLIAACDFPRMGLYESPERFSPAMKFSPDRTDPGRLARMYAAAVPRVDVVLQVRGTVEKPKDGKDGETPALVTDLEGCGVPFWSKGRRICMSHGKPATDGWTEYFFAFTPTVDLDATLDVRGAQNGEKTQYDDFRVTGAELVNGDCSTAKGWKCMTEVPAGARGDTSRPFGLVDETLVATHDLIVLQTVKAKKGQRVEIRFRARRFAR